MANIKVVDVNEEDKQEEPPVVEEPPIIEEVKPEEEVVNEVVEEVNEEVKEEERPKPKANHQTELIVILVVKIYHTKTIDTDTKNCVQQNQNL